MKLDNFFNNPSLYLFVYLRWIYQLKERYDFENCSSLKNFLSKKPKFHTFYQGLLNLLRKQSFRSQRISYARTGPPGRPGSVCWILSGLFGLDCMDSVDWQRSTYSAGFRSALKFYTRLEKAASWNQYPLSLMNRTLIGADSPQSFNHFNIMLYINSNCYHIYRYLLMCFDLKNTLKIIYVSTHE